MSCRITDNISENEDGMESPQECRNRLMTPTRTIALAEFCIDPADVYTGAYVEDISGRRVSNTKPGKGYDI